MEWENNKVEIIVEYINKELVHRTMIDIEKNDFGVNERVIHKRLVRKGYKKIEREYKKEIPKYNESITRGIPKHNEGTTKVILKDNKSITSEKKAPSTTIIRDDKTIEKKSEEKNQDIQIINNIDIASIKELIELIEPIKEVIQKYNEGITKDNIVDVDPIEININRKILNNKIKSVGFKLDEVVYESWRGFTKEFKDIKNQDLLGMALIEYMKKYGSNIADK